MSKNQNINSAQFFNINSNNQIISEDIIIIMKNQYNQNLPKNSPQKPRR